MLVDVLTMPYASATILAYEQWQLYSSNNNYVAVLHFAANKNLIELRFQK